MKRSVVLVAILVVFGIGVVTLMRAQSAAFRNAPPKIVAIEYQADRIVVEKAKRELFLLKDGKTIRKYRISLGGNPIGHKAQEGDGRTPEGEYMIDWRNANSIAHLSLHISYPNQQDIDQAKERGVSPGGNIMIHGMLNGLGWLGTWHLYRDWTQGCIAVTDAEMREIWSLVPNGTPIFIRG